MSYPNPITTVDVVLLVLRQEKLNVLLVRREKEPYAGQLALPGGFIHADTDADSKAAAVRVLKDKAGVVAPYLEQLYTFADGARDPRGWSVSITYFAVLPGDCLDPEEGRYVLLPLEDLPQLSFDHNRIVAVAQDRMRIKGAYSSLPAYLLGETFTLTELQRAYEIATQEKLHPAVFRRKLAELGFVEPTGDVQGGKHRPAQLYRLKNDKRLALFERTV